MGGILKPQLSLRGKSLAYVLPNGAAEASPFQITFMKPVLLTF